MSRKPSPGETIRHSWEVTITGGRIELVGTKKTATVGFGRPVRVGTGDSCHIVVNDPGVSCVHVEIMATPEGIRVQDLSTNGLFVGDVRVTAALITKPSELRLGAETWIKVLPSQPQVVADARGVRFGRLIGVDRTMVLMFERLRSLAKTDIAVLLTGETGTGKECAARSLHDEGPRRRGPFEAINCAAVPSALIESELFGHEKGAFTGADRQKKGIFERAAGGTLFLDEIGDASWELQTKLLRAIERREVIRVGGATPIPCDVRIVCATHVNLLRAIEEERFRGDLYYRLEQAKVHLPALRDRHKDIPVIAAEIVRELGYEGVRMDAPTATWLENHPWPGNVRELHNVIAAAVKLQRPGSGTTLIIPQMHPENEGPHTLPDLPPLKLFLEDAKREYFRELYGITRGNMARMVQMSGYSTTSVQAYLVHYGLVHTENERHANDTELRETEVGTR